MHQRVKKLIAVIGALTMGPVSSIGAADAGTSSAKSCAPAPRSALVVNVKDKGARGDGKTNDTAAIQAAIDSVAGTGGTVFLPAGKYMVDATGKAPLTLKLKSDMRFKLAPNATLKVIPTSEERYTLLSGAGITNVVLEGGTLEGDRKEHQGTSGEWGMGIRIEGGSSNVIVSGMSIKKMWGDGIYIWRATNVTICHVIADRNRRQGLSIIAADGVTVTNSVFRDTKGTRPAAGIDLEPNRPADTISNVRIENSRFIDNEGPGVLIAGKKGTISNLAITSNVFQGMLPIVVEDAREVADDGICRNRHISKPQVAQGGLTGNAEPIPVTIVQDRCGDRRIMVRRGKGK